MNEYTLLHSGRNLPDDGEPLIRNKGVALRWISVPLLHGRMLVSVGRL